MLTSFTIKRTFNKLRVTLAVDCEAREAEACVTYNRRIVRQVTVQFEAVRTPEEAEAWFTYPRGERGSLVETLEAEYRRLAFA